MHPRTRADDCVLLVSWGQPDSRDDMVSAALKAGCAMVWDCLVLSGICLPSCLLGFALHRTDCASTCAC